MASIKFTESSDDKLRRGSAVINMPSSSGAGGDNSNEKYDSQLRRSEFSNSTLAMPTPDIPSNMHDDFQWDRMSDDGGDDDADDDEGAQELTRFWRMHPLLRAFLIMIGGGIFLIIPTIGVLASHRDLPFRDSLDENAENFQNDYNLQCVARSFALMTAIWIIGVLFYHLVEMVPDGVVRVWRIFKGKRGLEKLKDRLQFFIAIKLYIKMIIISAAALVCFVIMFPNASYRFTGKVENGSASWDQVLFQVNVLLLFACTIFAAEKLLLKVIATRFHRSAYKERLAQQTYASWVLDHLNRSREQEQNSAKNTPYMEDTATFPTGGEFGPGANNSRNELLHPKEEPGAEGATATRGISELDTPPPLNKRTSTSSSFWRNTFSKNRPKHQKKPSRTFASRLWHIRDFAMDGGIQMNSNTYAGRLARKLFNALQNERNYLIVDDFLPFFDKEEDAIKAFEFFDKDNNGDISKREMRDRVLLIYKERRVLLNALSDMSQVVGKLDLFLTAFALVVIVIIALMVFGLDALKSLATMGTMFVAWSFVFGGTFKNIFECIIFLFQVHPYDVGDTVFLNTENLTVYKIRLLSTVFFKTDGTYTVYPNTVLATMKIQNLRRSNPQCESIIISFSFDTPTDKIYALRDRMNAYVDDNPRDFIAPIGFNIDLLENCNRIQVSVGINYKNNWQDVGKHFDCKTRFTFALREAIRDLGLKYSLPLQPVSMVPPPPEYDDIPNDESSENRRSVNSAPSDDDDDLFGPPRGGRSRRPPEQRDYNGDGSGGAGGPGGGGGGSAAIPAAAGMVMASEAM
ncbi:hypothetical protein H4R20_000091 [Coemansia guatemalensis]|uniref:EF-hand domain-containing protein n=1 Tax=Coemansia guatemalensis TaxID=2761395 RepID=A0A9W8I5Y4_9FUNG|nr:hypothetical protein H4R20_000091 [Coemansia guatemalensis]